MRLINRSQTWSHVETIDLCDRLGTLPEFSHAHFTLNAEKVHVDIRKSLVIHTAAYWESFTSLEGNQTLRLIHKRTFLLGVHTYPENDSNKIKDASWLTAFRQSLWPRIWQWVKWYIHLSPTCWCFHIIFENICVSVGVCVRVCVRECSRRA